MKEGEESARVFKDNYGLVQCDLCADWVERRGARQKYCTPCRETKVNPSYRKKYYLKNKKTLDRTEVGVCPDCQAWFPLYTAAKGGPNQRCDSCKKANRYRNKQIWRKSPAGKESRRREERRKNGELVPDQRMGPKL